LHWERLCLVHAASPLAVGLGGPSQAGCASVCLTTAHGHASPSWLASNNEANSLEAPRHQDNAPSNLWEVWINLPSWHYCSSNETPFLASMPAACLFHVQHHGCSGGLLISVNRQSYSLIRKPSDVPSPVDRGRRCLTLHRTHLPVNHVAHGRALWVDVDTHVARLQDFLVTDHPLRRRQL
jgi:hypothetical protein